MSSHVQGYHAQKEPRPLLRPPLGHRRTTVGLEKDPLKDPTGVCLLMSRVQGYLETALP